MTTSSKTKLLLAAGGVLVALSIAIAAARSPSSPTAAEVGPASADPSFSAPNSQVAPSLTAPLPTNAPVSSLTGGPCACADIPVIQARIREIDAVTPLYQNEINRLQSNPPLPPYTAQAYQQFQSTLQPVVDALANQYGVSTFAQGDTSMFCSVTTNPKATKCMQMATLTHESVHSAMCQHQRGFPASVAVGTWKQQIGLVAVYQNEIAAYQAEKALLQPILASLSQSCASWTGTITSTFAINMVQNLPMPPLKPGVQVTSSNTTYDRTRQDKWTFSGAPGLIPQASQGIWSGSLNFTHTLVEDSAFLMTPPCKNLSGHTYIKDTANGTATGKANLLVTISGPVAHVSVMPDPNDPPAKVATTRTKYGWGDVIQNDYCGHRVSGGSQNPIPGTESFPQNGVDFEAPVDPQHPGVLKGTLLKPGPDGSTTTLTWDLTNIATSPLIAEFASSVYRLLGRRSLVRLE